jgi:hypothetical protein
VDARCKGPSRWQQPPGAERQLDSGLKLTESESRVTVSGPGPDLLGSALRSHTDRDRALALIISLQFK